ncbi:MAG TPA: TetR family transcriptional regulator [Mycobacterium sp.]|jgi:AcrR family transcriptional regulator
MVSAEPKVRLTSARRTAAQTRVLDAALDLISVHGVSGTSLQMIADTVGVTKAAVYHQFKTKDEIVIALTERELDRLADALEAAEAEENRLRARQVLLTRVVDLAIERRGAVSTLQFDPVIVRLLAEHEPFQQFIDRLYGALLGDETGTAARVEAAMLSGVISTAVMHPLVADVDDDHLREQVLRYMRRLVDLPG